MIAVGFNPLPIAEAMMILNQAPPAPRPLPNPIKTEGDLADWLNEQSAASAGLEHLQHGRARLLLSASIEQIAKHDAEAAQMRLRTERAGAMIADFREREERRLAELARVQPELRALHVKAAKAREEGARILAEVYAPAAAQIRDAILRMTEISTLIAEANRRRPEGEEPISTLEDLRGYPALPDSVEEKPETYYVRSDTGEEGLPHIGAPGLAMADPDVRVGTRWIPLEARIRTKREHVRGRAAYSPRPLAETVVLPSVSYDDPPYWPRR